MFRKRNESNIVGLDIEAGSIAATEVRGNGSVAVARHGIAPLAPGLVRDGEVVDPEALGDALKAFFAEHKLSRNVRLGIANQRVAVRTLRLPRIEDRAELETAIRFQAQDHIPMPLDQAVLDWQVVGSSSPAGEDVQAQTIEVVVAAGRRDMLGAVMTALDEAGLRAVGIDLSAFGMIRALAGDAHAAVGAAGFVDAPSGVPAPGAPAPGAPVQDGPVPGAPVAGGPIPGTPVPGAPGPGGAVAEDAYEQRMAAQQAAATAGAAIGGEPAAPGARLYCNLGDVVNLAVAQGRTCLFTRISPFGLEGMAARLAERRELTLEQARQFLTHVGLAAPVGELEGDPETIAAAREVLTESATRLVDELRRSLEFYAAQETAVAVESVVASGPGTTIPGLLDQLQAGLGYPFSIGRPPALAPFGDPEAARLTLSYGLALSE